MSSYSPVEPREGFIPSDRFDVDQFVRVHLPNGRTEIGVVSSITDDFINVTTTQGYDIKVPPRSVRRAFLLVLDLNGVLVARGRGTFVHRPHVEEFMKFAFANFIVAVWTSGLERSSNPIIDSIFHGYKDRLLFTFYRDACTQRPTDDNPYGTVKNLQRIFDTYPKSFHSVNTIIVDDSPGKCSHPDIALCPVPFQDPLEQKNDDGLAKAMSVLQEVLMLDSHTPLILAAEQRLEALHHASASTLGSAAIIKATTSQQQQPPPPPAAAARPSPESASAADTLEEITLWKNRLCCDNLRGRCWREKCRFSHDEDDGKRPCSRKSRCQYGHESRWVQTESERLQAKERDEHRYGDKAAQYVSVKPRDGDNHNNNNNHRQQQQQQHHHHQQDVDDDLHQFGTVPNWKLNYTAEDASRAEEGEKATAACPRICCDFLRGNCKFRNCRYSHEDYSQGSFLCSRYHCPYGHNSSNNNNNNNNPYQGEEMVDDGDPWSMPERRTTGPSSRRAEVNEFQPYENTPSSNNNNNNVTKFFSTCHAATSSTRATTTTNNNSGARGGGGGVTASSTRATNPPPPQPRHQQQQQQQQQVPARRSGEPKVVHLTGRNNDGRALLRELQAITRNN